jgi:hypothetical protein
MSYGTKLAVRARSKAPTTQAAMQIARIATWREYTRAIKPAKNGAKAAPPFSIKY